VVQAKKDVLAELNYKVSEILKRLKILEERSHSLAEKLESLNNDLVTLKKNFSKFKADNNSKFNKIEREIDELKTKINHFDRELPKLVKKSEVETLKKVFSLWDPMNFVSEKELDFILQDKLEDLYYKLIKNIKNKEFDLKNQEKDKKDLIFPKEDQKNEKRNELLNFININPKDSKKEEISKKPDLGSLKIINPANKFSKSNERKDNLEFKHIKVPSKIKNKSGNFLNKENKNLLENNNAFEEKKEKNESFPFYEDLVDKKKKKLEKIENKFKEKIRNIYEEFKKDWEEV